MKFEHVSNALCLELANSVPDRVQGERDWLHDSETAADWATSLGLGVAPTFTSAELAKLREFREYVFAAFDAVATNCAIPQSALDGIAEEYARGLRAFGLRGRSVDVPGFSSVDDPHGGVVVRAWPEKWTVAALTALFAESAMAELNGDRLGRLKSCPSCHWLFIDTSRNRGRRWCSMQTCGGRDKALRHYRRSRA